jgi:riboflavin kinase/FMN adenylyltransferase
MENDEKLLPARGIYAVFARVNDTDAQLHKGMMSIGIRPTVGGTKQVTEVYLFDFSRDIYGRQLEVFVVKRLRDEVNFPDLPSLTRQIDQDAQDSLQVLAAPDALKMI